MSAGDEAAGRLNNIPSIIARALVPNRVGNAMLERDEEEIRKGGGRQKQGGSASVSVQRQIEWVCEHVVSCWKK